jgi:hypothetical protein
MIGETPGMGVVGDRRALGFHDVAAAVEALTI